MLLSSPYSFSRCSATLGAVPWYAVIARPRREAGTVTCRRVNGSWAGAVNSVPITVYLLGQLRRQATRGGRCTPRARAAPCPPVLVAERRWHPARACDSRRPTP